MATNRSHLLKSVMNMVFPPEISILVGSVVGNIKSIKIYIIILIQVTNLMHISFILQQYVCYTTILRMFRAARCSSSGGQIVSLQPLVSSPSGIITLCKHRYSMQVESGLSSLFNHDPSCKFASTFCWMCVPLFECSVVACSVRSEQTRYIPI